VSTLQKILFRFLNPSLVILIWGIFRYYGFLLFAELVSDVGHKPQIAAIPSLDAFDLAHYAVYSSSSDLQKLVILNLDYVNGTSPRTYKTFDVSSEFGDNITVKRLTGSTSIATDGLTWVGQNVDGNGNLSGTNVVEKVTNGVVSIGSSEAVIIERAR
jgi:hypothetical protein